MADLFNRRIVEGAAADGAPPVGNPVPVAGSDGANAQTLLVDTLGRPIVVGAAADGAAADGNPVQVAGKDGSGNIQALSTDVNGNLNVNAGGAAVAPTVTRVTSVNLAPAATVDLDSPEFGGTTKQLAGVDLTSSVPWKANIIRVDDGVETVRTTIMGQPGQTVEWRPPNKSYFSVAFGANAGFDGWRVKFLNRNDAGGQSADVYATFYTED